VKVQLELLDCCGEIDTGCWRQQSEFAGGMVRAPTLLDGVAKPLG